MADKKQAKKEFDEMIIKLKVSVLENILIMYKEKFGYENFESKYGSTREFLINEIGIDEIEEAETLDAIEKNMDYCHVCGKEAFNYNGSDGTYACWKHKGESDGE